MRALVTGSRGFIGTHLCRTLQENGHEVIEVDSTLDVDVRDTKKISELCRGVTTIFHLAALVSVEESLSEPFLYHEVNAMGTLSLLEAMRATAPRARLILDRKSTRLNSSH